MALIRRNPLLSTAVLSVMVVVACGLLLWPRHEARAQAAYTPLSAVDAGRLAQLRAQLGLSDDALAALNLTDEQLLTLLPALRSWYEGHTDSWVTANADVANQRARIRALEATLAGGKDVVADLETARARLTQLEAVLEGQLADLHTAASGVLSESQQAVFARLRANRGQSLPLGLLELSAEQKAAVERATASYQQRLALAHDQATHAALAQEYAQAFTATIGSVNASLVSTLREYCPAASARVVAALQTVFPVATEEE